MDKEFDLKVGRCWEVAGGMARTATPQADSPTHPARSAVSEGGSPVDAAPQTVVNTGSSAGLATLAQLVEHVTENHGVPSSILGGRTISSSGVAVRRITGAPPAPRASERVVKLVVHVPSDVLYRMDKSGLV